MDALLCIWLEICPADLGRAVRGRVFASISARISVVFQRYAYVCIECLTRIVYGFTDNHLDPQKRSMDPSVDPGCPKTKIPHER